VGTESKAPGSTGKRAVFLPLLLVAVVYLLAASGRAVIDYDEGYYAQAARQMIERGDWGVAALYVAASVVGSVAALFAALVLLRSALA